MKSALGHLVHMLLSTPPVARWKFKNRSLNQTFQTLTVALVSWVLLASCGKAPSQDATDFGVYIKAFNEAGAANYGFPVSADNVSIQFGKLDDGTLAQCNLSMGTTPAIIVNSDTWPGLSDDAREVTVIHELGHCVLERKHTNKEINTTRKYQSVMLQWPQLITDYKANKDQYMKELFENPGT